MILLAILSSKSWTVISIGLGAALALMIVSFWSAPEGYQNKNGFHHGKERHL